MKLLKELFSLIEDSPVSVTKSVAAKVYHRDYLKTKNKKYRKYNPRKRTKQNTLEETSSLSNIDHLGFDYDKFTLEQLKQELADAIEELRDMKMVGEPAEDIELIKQDIQNIRAAIKRKFNQ